MFAQSAALLFFVTEKLTDGKPLERLFEFALVRCDHPRQAWRQLGPQGDFTLAFVSEIEKLSDDLIAAFLFVKLSWFEDGPFPFDKAVAAGHFAPFREDVIPRCAIARQKIAKSG